MATDGKMGGANIEKVASYMKISKELKTGHNGDDFIRDQLTAVLYGTINVAAREEGELTAYVPAPSFFDWLFRRSKTIRVPYLIKHLAKIDIPDALTILNQTTEDL